MSEPKSGSTATDQEKVVKTDNMSEGDFIQRRLAGKGTAKAESEAEKQKEAEPKEKAEKPKSKDDAPEASEQDVLSKAKSGNLDDLSEDELSQLAKSIGRTAVAPYGELTAKRKAAEERVRQEAAAVAQAIEFATGRILDRLPMTPERVLSP